MNYGELKAAVNTSAGPRDDIPEHIYDLVLSEVNRDIRITEMLETATLTVSGCTTEQLLLGTCDCEHTALPADFLEMESAYTMSGSVRRPVYPIHDSNGALPPSATNMRYAITADGIRLIEHPVPTTSLYITYFKANAALTTDAGTNVVLLNYPELYLYLSLAHVAIWARSMEEAMMHRANYEDVRSRVMKSDLRKRMAGPLRASAMVVA